MRSIRRTVTRTLAATLGLVGAAALLAAFLVIRARLSAQHDATLRATAAGVAGLLQIDHGRPTLDAQDATLAAFARREGPAYFEVRDAGGRSLLRSAALGRPLDGSLPRPGETLDDTLPDGRAGRVVCMLVHPRDERDEEDEHPVAATASEAAGATVLLYVAADRRGLDASIRWVGLALGGSLAGLLVAVAAAVPPVVRRGLRPLDAMSAQAARIDARELSQRFGTSEAPAELRPIAAALNGSLDRIQAAFERERRFAADAAHELRTPLAAIRTNAEVALRWPEPGQVAASLADIVAASARLQRLVERLLELARLGTSDPDAEAPVEVDLAVAARASVDRCVPADQRQHVSMSAANDARVRTQPELLAPLLDNLIVNAVTHGPPDTRVSVIVGVEEAAWVAVENQTDRLAEADLTRMFEPLWTRSDDRSAGHAGLGLALVAEYARALGGRVDARLAADGRLTMRVTLPIAALQTPHGRTPAEPKGRR